MKKTTRIIILTVLLFLLYVIPSQFTPFDEIWYDALNKPVFTPPQIVFPIVWTILFALLSLSAACTLLTKTVESKRFYIMLLILQYFFIQMYTYIQFSLKDIYLGFVDILLVLITTFMLYLTGMKLNKKASSLILIVLLWVIYAAFIQVGILKYN